MDPQLINILVENIPAELILYAGDGQPTKCPQSIHDRFIENVAHALNDPAFGWKFVAAFAEQKRDLPSGNYSYSLREAWHYLSNGFCRPAFREALILRQEPMRRKRALLEALLIIPSLTLGLIAKLTSVSVAAVEIYSELWFDVRDRFDDCAFIANIVYPNTRQQEFQKDYWKTVTPECLLLRAGHNTGSAEVVLELFGAVSTSACVPEAVLKKLIRHNLIAEAHFVIQLGGCHQDLPIMRQMIKLIAADIKAAARAPKPTAWVASGTMSSQSLLPAAKQHVAVHARKSTLPKTGCFIAPSEVSEPSETSVVSAQELIPTFRNPDLAVSLPSRFRRRMSWDLATPNRCPSKPLISP